MEKSGIMINIKELKKYEDHIKIIGLFIILLFLFLILRDMFEKAWFVIEKILLLYEKETGEPIGIIMHKWRTILMLASGFVLGSMLVTIIFDYKKRLSGILLSIAAIPLILMNKWTILKYFIAFAVGILIGSVITYKTAKPILRRKNYLKCEIGTTSIFVFGFLAVTVAVFFVAIYYYKETNTILNGDLMMYLLVSGAFVYVLKKFSEQEIKTKRIVVVGPYKSGKTVFMGACYDYAVKHDYLYYVYPNPSSDLREIHRELTNGKWPPPTPLDEYREYEFTYITARGVFKREIKLYAIDYSGEHFETVVEYITGKRNIDELYKSEDAEKDKKLRIVKKVVESIKTADYIIFLISAKELEENVENLRKTLDKYLEIYDKLKKPYYLVATMCDILWEEGWDISKENYEKLEKKVFEMLEKISEFNMLYDNSEGFICVLVFETKEKKPMVTDYKLVSLGFDKVLEAI